MLHQRSKHALRGSRDGNRVGRRLFRSGLSLTISCLANRCLLGNGLVVAGCYHCLFLALFCCVQSAAADDSLTLNAPQSGTSESARATNVSKKDTVKKGTGKKGTGKKDTGKKDTGKKTGSAEPSSATRSTAHTSGFAISESQARSSVQWLAELAIRHAPRTYDADKNWGDTKEIFSGIKFDPKGLRLRPSRRTKEVRHGRWIKYELLLPEPKPGAGKTHPDGLVATVHRVSKSGDISLDSPFSDQSNTHWRIDSSVETPMTFTARVERWNRGVQIYSISFKGKMRVRLDSTTSLAFHADYAEVPPAFVINPKVIKSELHLKEFEVDRVSKIGGDVAEEWGEMIEKVVREVFLAKQNEKLTGKLNKSIDKHRDDLRLSMSDWLKTW